MNKITKKYIRSFYKIAILYAVCLFAFIFVSPVVTSATDINSTTNNTTTNDNDNEGKSEVSGNLGPLQFNLDTGTGNGLSSTLQIMIVLTLISLAPSIIIMVTSFTRIIIVLHFVRSALGTQSTPPNQILIGLALFLTMFIMSPVFSQINNDAIKPLNNNQISQEQAFDAGIAPIREFMLEQVKPKDLKLFMNIAEIDTVDSLDEIPTTVIIPAFIISELRIAFIIGFVIYIPFIVIDMVVASTLMSMGMMMLPPTTISMPFKILLFILADGWGLIIGELVKTFT